MLRKVFSGGALAVLFLVMQTAAASAYTNTWSMLPDIPGSHTWGGAATLPDGRIMTVAGTSTDTDIYSPSTNSWSAGAPLPLLRTGLGLVRLGSLVYAIGGEGSSGNPKSGVWAYNPSMNSWTVKANLPTDRAYAGVVVSGGKIYVIGGEDDSFTPTRTVYRYTPSTNSWSSAVAQIPAARYDGAAAADSSGRIYFFGGCCNANGRETKSVYRYTPSTNSWVTRASLTGTNGDSHNQNTTAALGSDGQIYVFGGGNFRIFWHTTRIYNPTTNTWHDGADMPFNAEASAAATGTDGVIYALGGRPEEFGCEVGVDSDPNACPHQAQAYH